MKHIALRSEAALLSYAAVIATAVLALTPTMVLAAGADELGMTAVVNGILGLFTGPIAKLACAILVIIGVILFSRGHDMGEGVKTIGTVALGAGLLIGLVAILAQINGTGAMIPDLPTHAAAAVAHHVNSLRVK
jgi:type IV secretory pathway VirB2 component (pilin)